MLMLNNLIGFGAGGGAGEISHITFTYSDTASLTGASGIVAGDVLLFFDWAQGGTTPSDVIPTGFTGVVTVSNSVQRVRLSYKLADGSEASATITGMSATNIRKYCHVYRRAPRPATALAIHSLASELTAGDPSAQVIASASGRAPLLCVGCYGVNSTAETISGHTMSPTEDGEVTSSALFKQKYKIYNSAPADVTVDIGDRGAGTSLISYYMEVT